MKTNLKKIHYSVILPIYNQATQAESLVKEYKKVLQKIPNGEILFIVNGSSDESYQKLVALTTKDTRFKIFNLVKGGWGRAVLFGLQKAAGDYLCYSNSARTTAENILHVYKYSQGHPMLVTKASRITRDNWLRRIGSTLYNIWARILLRTPVWDVNGTPKILTRSVLKKIKLESVDDLIDAELIYKCTLAGIPFIEVPLWQNLERQTGKTTTNWKSAYKMFKGVWLLRKKHGIR